MKRSSAVLLASVGVSLLLASMFCMMLLGCVLLQAAGLAQSVVLQWLMGSTFVTAVAGTALLFAVLLAIVDKVGEP